MNARVALSRALLILITLVFATFFYGAAGHVDFAENWGDGSFGLTLGLRNNVVRAVRPGSPAARAGIRAGDRLVLPRDVKAWQRLRAPYAGSRTEVVVRRAGAPLRRVRLVAVPVPHFGVLQRIGGVLDLIPPTVFLLVAFALVFLRPSVMSWSFYVFSIGYFGTQPAMLYWSHVLPAPAFTIASFVTIGIFGAWSPMPLLPFVLRFPNGDLAGWRHRADVLIWIVVSLSLVVAIVGWAEVTLAGHNPAWYGAFNVYLPLLAFALGAAIVLKNYSAVKPADRQRTGFLVLGVIASFVAYAIYFLPFVSQTAGQIAQLGVVIMPICIAYAVFRLRVLDINFVLNRALVIGLLSIFVIALLSLLDWAFSQLIGLGRFTLGLELLVTIAAGFLLDRINRALNRAVEWLFFRKRHEAEAYLRRTAVALPYATDERAVTEALVQVPAEALHLSAAAMYRGTDDGRRFEGLATSAQTPLAPHGFDANDLLVRMLLAGEVPVWLDPLRSALDASAAALYVIAVPVVVRHELVSFTLYGAHQNGAQLDPDEIELLSELAKEAARAYDHIEAVRVRERYALGAAT